MSWRSAIKRLRRFIGRLASRPARHPIKPDFSSARDNQTFNRRTLFILGAGASKEVKLPLGRELLHIIYGKLNLMTAHAYGDKSLLETFTWCAPNGNINPYVSAAQKIADGLPLLHSIDDYLEIHRDDELIQFVAKLAIVKSIMDAERASPLSDARSTRHQSRSACALVLTDSIG